MKAIDDFFLAEGLAGYAEVRRALESRRARTELTFNLYDVVIDRDADVVVLTDSCTVFGEEGVTHLSVDEFDRLVSEWHAAHALPRPS